jgi:hypothetical protein
MTKTETTKGSDMTRITWQTTTGRTVAVEIDMIRSRRINPDLSVEWAQLTVHALLDGEPVNGYIRSITPFTASGLTIVAAVGNVGIPAEQMAAIKSSPEWAEDKANAVAAHELGKKLDAAHAAREAIYHQCDDSDAC